VSGVRKQIDEALYAFVDRQRPLLGAVSDDLSPLLAALDALLSGGKRLRPLFCYWGWRGTGGEDLPEFFNAAASLELLQAGALIHDDVMDGSDTRRGQPAGASRRCTPSPGGAAPRRASARAPRSCSVTCA
jgi:geranylgeranyl diphosphate synthase type I